MSNTRNLYGQRIQQLLDECPLGKEAPGVSLHLIEEGRRHWCRRVAEWTDNIRGDSTHDPKANDMMNWYIRKLQPGQPARDRYNDMLRILQEGYELIGKWGDCGRWLELPGSDDSSPGTTRKLKPDEFATYAIGEIRSRFADPLEVCLGRFPGCYSSEFDPIVMPKVQNIFDALDDFRTHFEQAGVSGKQIATLRTWRHDPDFLGVPIHRRRFGEGPRTPFEDATTHGRPDRDGKQIDNFIEKYDSVPDSYSELRAQISRDDGMRPEPWIWLGINLLASSDPPRRQVFDSLIPSSQINMGTRIVFSPDYLQLLCNVLTHVRDTVVAGGIAGKGADVPATEPQGNVAPPASEPLVAHSPDFRSVCRYGRKYTFTAAQAACVEILWKAYDSGCPDISDATVLGRAGCDTERLDHVFRKHPAWGTMIVRGETKGTHRLQAPPRARALPITPK